AEVGGDPGAAPPGRAARGGEVRPPREGGAPLGRRSLQDRGRVEGTRSRGGHPSRRRRQSRPALTRADAYFVRISSMKARARGSLDWPSQKIACLRTSGLRFLRATSIKSGTPSWSGICVSAKTAFFLTSVSGSFWMASWIALAAFLPAFCASQNRAWPRTEALASWRAMSISVCVASGTLLCENAKG